METPDIRVKRDALENFCQGIFRALKLSEDDARIATAVLIAADALDIPLSSGQWRKSSRRCRRMVPHSAA